MPIASAYDPGSGCFRHTCTGRLTRAEILEALDRYYRSPDPCPLVLWDGTAATLSDLTPADLRQVAQRPTAYLHEGIQPDGRRAIVVSNDLDYGLSRMIDQFKELAAVQMAHQVAVFRSVEAAVDWLHGALDDEEGRP